MPIYEYECQECGRIFEKIQRFSDDPLTEYECESCERTTPVRKRVSAAAFHLKGGGWYVTDFRDGGKKAGKGEAGSDKGEAGKDKSEKTGSDSKSDAGGSKGESKKESESGSKNAAKSAGSAS